MSKPFETLVITRKALAGSVGGYKIYKAANDYVLVAANTVQEALETSGIKDAIRIERDFIGSVAVLDASTFAAPENIEKPVEVAVVEPPVATPIAEAPANPS